MEKFKILIIFSGFLIFSEIPLRAMTMKAAAAKTTQVPPTIEIISTETPRVPLAIEVIAAKKSRMPQIYMEGSMEDFSGAREIPQEAAPKRNVFGACWDSFFNYCFAESPCEKEFRWVRLPVKDCIQIGIAAHISEIEDVTTLKQYLEWWRILKILLKTHRDIDDYENWDHHHRTPMRFLCDQVPKKLLLGQRILEFPKEKRSYLIKAFLAEGASIERAFPEEGCEERGIGQNFLAAKKLLFDSIEEGNYQKLVQASKLISLKVRNDKRANPLHCAIRNCPGGTGNHEDLLRYGIFKKIIIYLLTYAPTLLDQVNEKGRPPIGLTVEFNKGILLNDCLITLALSEPERGSPSAAK